MWIILAIIKTAMHIKMLFLQAMWSEEMGKVLDQGSMIESCDFQYLLVDDRSRQIAWSVF